MRSIKEVCLDPWLISTTDGKHNHQGLGNELIERARTVNGETVWDQRRGGVLKYYRCAA